MVATPQTEFQLLVCPLTKDQENQLTFENINAQDAYFEGLPKITLTECTYQRKDNVIRFRGNVDSLRHYNYVRYRNPQFQNKWFYAFVDHMEYVNEYTTHIYIKTDVFQTWQFRFTLEPCFIEREHVADDGFGIHTIPEGLEYGNYLINEFIPMNWADLDQSLICLQVSDLPSKSGITDTPVRIYNGMPSGCYYLVFKQENAAAINKWINAYVEDTKQDAIIAIFPIPATLAQPDDPSIPAQIGNLSNSIADGTYIWLETQAPVRLTTYQVPYALGSPIDGYTPKNNKLYCSPYCYFYLNTFTGSTIEYHYEDFTGPIQFTVYGGIGTGGEFRIVPETLTGSGGGDSGGYGYGISLSSMPQGSWNNNTYLNWRALNMDAIAIEATSDIATSVLQGVQQVANLDIFGLANTGVGLATRAAQRMNQQRLASKMPNQARGDTANQSLTWGMNHADGGFYRMTIRSEYAQIIDNYFSAFGYLVNAFRTPNITSRANWNYVKTIGCNLVAEIPQDDLEEIKQIFDRGCTFWHNPDNFLNYNAENGII